jgi:MFS family permease
MMVPTGVWADRKGRKKSMRLGLLVLVGASQLYGWWPNLALFAGAELLFALGFALMMGADEAWLRGLLEKHGVEHKQQTYWGRVMISRLLGMAVSGLIAGLLVDKWGYNAPMIAYAVPVLLAWVGMHWLEENHNGTPKPVPLRRELVELAQILKRNRRLRTWSLNLALVANSAYFVSWFYQPLLLELTGKESLLGSYFTILIIGEMMVLFLGATWLKRISVQRYAKASLWLVVAGYVVPFIWPSAWTVLFMLLTTGVFGWTRRALFTQKIHDMLPSDKRASLVSAVETVRLLMGAVVNVPIGLVADYSIPVAMLLAGGLALAALWFPVKED